MARYLVSFGEKGNRTFDSLVDIATELGVSTMSINKAIDMGCEMYSPRAGYYFTVEEIKEKKDRPHRPRNKEYVITLTIKEMRELHSIVCRLEQTQMLKKLCRQLKDNIFGGV